MTEPDQQLPAVEAVESEAFAEPVESDVDKARRFLAEAESQLAASYGRNFPAVALATAAGVVGAGYAQLAALEARPTLVLRQGGELLSTAQAAALRELQAHVEARPHDGEPGQLAVDDASPAEAPAPKPAARRKPAAKRGGADRD